MNLTQEQIELYTRRLLLARMHILVSHGFYGLLLMHMKFALDEQVETAATDGTRMYFAPSFLDQINDLELEFIMMHEILHVVLRHCFRQGGRDTDLFNVACDIVVNSNILKSCDMDRQAITLAAYGESMHLTPDGQEGFRYTAEQVYEMLASHREIREGWDDHTRWGKGGNDAENQDLWVKRLIDASEAIRSRDPMNSWGLLPAFAERVLKELKEPQTDWRNILNDFVQEEITDYSFMPPDNRYGDNDFFLPAYNEKEEYPRNILFMIDTSGSMSDDMITTAYSEVKGAIDQYGGKLDGWLGYFDSEVTEPAAFREVKELLAIKPAGGGGTDFRPVFHWVWQHMEEMTFACIIILTDGFAPFPEKSEAGGIPVLWMINNENVTPPWGKVARI